MNCRRPATSASASLRMEPAFTTRATTKMERCSISIFWARAPRATRLSSATSFAASTDDERYLVIEIDRGVPAKRVDIVYRDLSKPGSTFDILVWGLDARFS